MGQGSMTSLPLIFAEEMDADWSRVKVEFSPQETEIYGSEGWVPGSKLMFTVGSRTTNSYYPVMRKAGAQARYVLIHSTAKYWEVPEEEITTSKSFLIHEKSGKKISYGDIVPFLSMPELLPDFKKDSLKNPREFKLIGQQIPRTEIPAKVDGTAQFAIDMRLPEMVYGVLERGNLHGAQPTLTNEAEIPGYGRDPEISSLQLCDWGCGQKVLSRLWMRKRDSKLNGAIQRPLAIIPRKSIQNTRLLLVIKIRATSQMK